ncbi:hypothetical protein [Streptomyces xantholiticus]|uniref:hypothetical protein n=1 Tax=Streptomyces xantholiticus TaxID=68285 RepID=UPI00167737BB|nr:hypothetical protein [Streptomyces xantholiticus]GGW39060.1 hypothetical protein GCM10010381_24630 [Streptomyces xantholiticus]
MASHWHSVDRIPVWPRPCLAAPPADRGSPTRGSPTKTSTYPLAKDGEPCIHPAVAAVLGLTVPSEEAASGAHLADLVTAAVAIVLLTLG